MPENKVSRIIELNEDLIGNNDNLALQNNNILKEKKIKAIDLSLSLIK